MQTLQRTTRGSLKGELNKKIGRKLLMKRWRPFEAIVDVLWLPRSGCGVEERREARSKKFLGMFRRSLSSSSTKSSKHQQQPCRHNNNVSLSEGRKAAGTASMEYPVTTTFYNINQNIYEFFADQ